MRNTLMIVEHVVFGITRVSAKYSPRLRINCESRLPEKLGDDLSAVSAGNDYLFDIVASRRPAFVGMIDAEQGSVHGSFKFWSFLGEEKCRFSLFKTIEGAFQDYLGAFCIMK